MELQRSRQKTEREVKDKDENRRWMENSKDTSQREDSLGNVRESQLARAATDPHYYLQGFPRPHLYVSVSSIAFRTFSTQPVQFF